MLAQVKNIKKLIGASLFLVMMLPSLFSILHQFKSHKHIDCKEVKSHLHELTNECNTCDFNLLSFDFKLANTFETNKNQILKKIKLISNRFLSIYLIQATNNYAHHPICLNKQLISIKFNKTSNA
jgi:hypothetical protein